MLEAVSALRDLGVGTVTLLMVPATLAAAIGAFLGALVKALFDRHVKRDIEHLRSALDRIERQQATRMEDRSEAYGAIWKLTGAFNLFGPEKVTTAEELTKLTADLRDWYFTHGQMLTTNAHRHYFLIQEALMFCELKSILPARPDPAELYDSSKGDRTVERVALMFTDRLEKTSPLEDGPPKPKITESQEISKLIESKLEDGRKLRELEKHMTYLRDLVSFWMATAHGASNRDGSTFAWLILQHLFSRFRTRLTVEVKTRDTEI